MAVDVPLTEDVLVPLEVLVALVLVGYEYVGTRHGELARHPVDGLPIITIFSEYLGGIEGAVMKMVERDCTKVNRLTRQSHPEPSRRRLRSC